MTHALDRRAFLKGGGALIALAPRLHFQADTRGTRLVLLGTAGGPTPKVERSAPAQAIVVDGRVYLVDCGDGVARQLTIARLGFDRLRAVFLTHQHSDHNAGYGPLFLLGWVSGIREAVDTYGPPPLTAMTRQLLEAYRYDIELRMKDEGRPPLAPLVRPHEITSDGEVHRDELVRVTAVLNRHVPIEHSFAYRFDTADRSIVISGDTNYSERVRALAKNADVLVHEALYRPFWERPDAPLTPAVRRHIIDSHTDVEDVGRLAAEAGVKTLVLSHLVPTEPTGTVPDYLWLEAARRHFKGEVVLGRDLLSI
jgi:ribonuclease BN (tRNA processing enzyme)